MKIGIYYFSGTGNTAHFAEHLKIGFEKQADLVDQMEIVVRDVSFEPDFETDCDLIAIGGPIYAGNMPEMLIRWVLRNIPETKDNKPAIVFSTSAGSENAFGVESISCKLEDKGYLIAAKEIVEMPRNFYFNKYEKNSDDEIAARISAAEQRAESVGEQILEQIKSIAEGLPNNKKGILGRDLLAETFSVMAKFMGKNYHATAACVKCGTCVKHCPTQNIKLAGEGTKHMAKCMMCTKCLHICPVNAIQYKGKNLVQYNQLLSKRC